LAPAAIASMTCSTASSPAKTSPSTRSSTMFESHRQIACLIGGALLCVALVQGCVGQADSGADESSGATGAAGGEANTFDHPDVMPNVFDVLQRRQEEGPPEFASRMHACRKLKSATFGQLLQSRGVNLTATAATSAGALYRSGAQALSAPRY